MPAARALHPYTAYPARWARAISNVWVRYWRRQSPSRQDRMAALGPLVTVLLFVTAILLAFWYLRFEENEREAESVQRDSEVAQQLLRVRLVENQEALQRLTRDMGARIRTPEAFTEQAAELVKTRGEITHLAWLGPERERRAVYSDRPFHPEANPDGKSSTPTLPARATPSQASAESEATFAKMKLLRTPTYSAAFKDATGNMVVQLHLPVLQRNEWVGGLIAELSLDRLLRQSVPPEIMQRHTLQVVDNARNVLASNVAIQPNSTRKPTHESAQSVEPLDNGWMLRVQGWRTSLSILGNTLFWMVLVLSGVTVWMLLGSWQHMRRRTQIQATLVQETNFRRAMENSMLTGMRAMDREGRITYVNHAFCAMTGFSEAELLHKLPPFPFWPDDAVEANARLLQQELEGHSPPGGIEVRLAKKDGAVFDARMYISPLVDPKGQQTGWMTSITNITEAKRIRDQLSASHERFTTVLEGLDAVVSVLSVQQGELLFANRTYRHWFGADAVGHAQLAGATLALPELPAIDDRMDSDDLSGIPLQELTDVGAAPREVFVASMQKWFDVRARYLQWTDGRLAQMLVATDVTARRRGEELALQQAEKAQVTSRLVTMGEMASSVAHELNQPLTAITNYCNGMVSRVQAKTIDDKDLIAALEKTAKQAERAGQVIRRIRAFVKRSEPQRQPTSATTIIDDAVDLADIEMKRRNVRLSVYVAKRLPLVMCDPILIEQVVLNLVKNAAEAIDLAQLPTARRHIDLKVMPRHTPDEGGVIEFSVTDRGPGIREDVLARLYEAFFSTKVEGLGIGLSLCRSIVESHRGRIKGQNLYNGDVICGCKFTFTLPVETVQHTVSPTQRPDVLAEASPSVTAQSDTSAATAPVAPDTPPARPAELVAAARATNDVTP
jgi:PAS domain S-box-containing protein